MPTYPTSGQFGGSPYNNPQMQQPNPWVDPTQVIQSSQNDIIRQMNANMNSAANRLGAGGMLGGSTAGRAGNSSVYQSALGGAASDASRQMADVSNQYTYQSATNQANMQNSWAMNAQQQNQALLQDYWNRMYNALQNGGSTQYMQQWQNQVMPQAQQYAQSVNPWL